MQRLLLLCNGCYCSSMAVTAVQNLLLLCKSLTMQCKGCCCCASLLLLLLLLLQKAAIDASVQRLLLAVQMLLQAVRRLLLARNTSSC